MQKLPLPTINFLKLKSKSVRTYPNSKTEVELRKDDLWRTTAQVSAMHCGVLLRRRAKTSLALMARSHIVGTF